MSLLTGFRMVQIGRGLAAAVCGRLLADVGADVACIDPDRSTPLAEYLNHGKTTVAGQAAAAHDALGIANLIVCEGNPADLRTQQRDAAGVRRFNAAAALGRSSRRSARPGHRPMIRPPTSR